jgi:hypothetical protein
MYTGLLHTYETLAHLLFLVAILNLVLVLAKAGSDENIARILRYSHEIGILWFGRAMLLAGCGIIFAGGNLQEWCLWASILLWGPVEALGRRVVKTELRLVEDGGRAASRLTTGATIELLCILIIFGLMSAQPGI